MQTTWEVIVWDGVKWFRAAPPISFDTRQQAEDAIKMLNGLALAYIRTTRELETVGLPEGPPPNNQHRIPLDSVKRNR
jgi:hypothetical protein